MDTKERPILDIDGQINHLVKKGVKFEIISLKEAKKYLTDNNNYFKLRAYRKNFPKHPGGDKADTYINLDFSMLKDLAIIDMRLRYLLIHMALDIEHFSKVKLIKNIQESGNDGYTIVDDYFDNLKQQDKTNPDSNKYDHLWYEIYHKTNNPYCGDIIQKYNPKYAIWSFVEVVSLGTFIHFYKFCADQLNDKEMKDDFYLLMATRELRNAAAHNNCIIHDMGAKNNIHSLNYNVSRWISNGGISREVKNNKVSNIRMMQIVTLIYTHSYLVTSSGVHNRVKLSLNELVRRMFENIDYYSGNDTIITNFNFFKRIVDIYGK